ncbi:MAG: tRNA (guanosine(46)-N7)-methyltransferase TrmB [Bacteroidetes bacterium]|nr:tRNA (guanosine(46)-N7)-methyltransferase TrmB [Bacteroidota bacterium]
MPKKKLRRFKENLSFPNLFQYSYKRLREEGFPYKGQWHADWFNNEHPLILEIGCGKGEYTIGLSTHYPEKNFIGLDIKGARLWRGCKTALDQGLRNVAFIRCQIQFINHFFEKEEVSEMWITFPDPQIKKESKRLTHPDFLEKYRLVLKPDGLIHLKTDNADLFNYTLEMIQAEGHRLIFSTHDLYRNSMDGDAPKIRTYYENIFLEQGKTICYLKFQLNNEKTH